MGPLMHAPLKGCMRKLTCQGKMLREKDLNTLESFIREEKKFFLLVI